MENITLQDVINFKKLKDSEYYNDLRKLDEFDADENVYKLCGNKIIYHHQFENLIKTPAQYDKSFNEFMTNDTLRKKLLCSAIKRSTGPKLGRKITP